MTALVKRCHLCGSTKHTLTEGSAHIGGHECLDIEGCLERAYEGGGHLPRFSYVEERPSKLEVLLVGDTDAAVAL